MPLFTVWAGQAGRTPICHCLCCASRVSPGRFRPLMVAWISPSPKPSSARTGTNKVVRTPGARLTGCGCWLSSSSNPLAASAIFSVCGRSVRLVTSSTSRETSPPARKRGIFSSAITGAATTTLLSPRPKSSAVHACAITRSSPLKSPIGSVTTPSPCSLSVIGCACCAMILTWFTGGFPPRLRSSPSPPKRNAASRPCPSMTWP